jgi:hypothetical protein
MSSPPWRVRRTLTHLVQPHGGSGGPPPLPTLTFPQLRLEEKKPVDRGGRAGRHGKISRLPRNLVPIAAEALFGQGVGQRLQASGYRTSVRA